MHWKKVALAGLGLLGGSLGLALRERRLAREVAAFVRKSSSVPEALRRGAADIVSTDLGSIVKGADVVVLATPITEMASLARKMSPQLQPGALVMDVGSVKSSVVAEVSPIIQAAGGTFLGAHPMAGAEKSGMGHARSDLFEKAICVLTPTAETPDAVVVEAGSFWQAVGSRPLKLPAELHDAVVARSSHLPHLLAAQLANYVLDPAGSKEQRLLCASGFRDTTRIASGPPEMWRDIVLANRKNLEQALGEFITALERLAAALQQGDAEYIGEFLEKARQRRDQWQDGAESKG